ncbi:DUF4266 domain-containing protein [Paraliomyxa miuraensis]|uniref:DUF4266 domain-containing protein n=1 Tax=Paraliomyxa miuraensis TaxID=376150 RepID=UPI00224D0BFE|nr:DUF4266 domain-containing protein [Paraliomyxa miuraensis]MCX4245797.1 DUF4266 domain-containing protein [Paraliomyxa miuraensis]
MPEPNVWCTAPVTRLRIVVLGGSVGMALLTGCVTVSPAERQQLSKPEMTPATDASEEVWHTHVEAAREAGFGGHGAAGGGCGCG